MVDLLALAALCGVVGLVGVCQMRLVDAYMTRHGGPSRVEQHRLFLDDPRAYARLLRTHPGFGWRVIIRMSDDPLVEHRRRQLLGAALLLVPAIAFSIWATATAPVSVPGGALVVGGVAAAIVWAMVLVMRPTTWWLRAGALLGVGIGAAVALIGLFAAQT